MQHPKPHLQDRKNRHHPPAAAAETLTKQFRQEALQLCQHSSGTPEAWQAAQHLLDQCWMLDENDKVGATPSTSRQNSNGAVTTVFGCPECGAVVHPGWEGTSLRVARLSLTKAARTRRRRLQRKQRRLLLSEQKQAKDHNKLNKLSPPPNNSASTMDQSSSAERMILLRDDPELVFDRHHLVVQCGKCEAKIRLKGLKREMPVTKQALQRVQRMGVVNATTRTKRDDRKAAGSRSYSNDRRTTSNNDDHDAAKGDGAPALDFLELPPPAPKKNTPGGVRPKPALPLTLPNPKKPKNKQKKVGVSNNNKKGKLFNFLSSLND